MGSQKLEYFLTLMYLRTSCRNFVVKLGLDYKLYLVEVEVSVFDGPLIFQKFQ